MRSFKITRARVTFILLFNIGGSARWPIAFIKFKCCACDLCDENSRMSHSNHSS